MFYLLLLSITSQELHTTNFDVRRIKITVCRPLLPFDNIIILPELVVRSSKIEDL